MALPPQTNEAFLREVDDELRRDQFETFWKRWGRTLVVAVVVGLVLLAGLLYWQHRRVEARDRAGETLSGLLDELDRGNLANAPKVIGELQNAGPGYKAAAMLLKGDLAQAKGDAAGAVAAFRAVRDDASLPQPFRDAALIRMTGATFDTTPPQQVIASLKPLAAPGNPWFGSAGEMSALAHLKLGQLDQAAALFAAVARDKGAPPSVRARTAQMASSLGQDVGSAGISQ